MMNKHALKLGTFAFCMTFVASTSTRAAIIRNPPGIPDDRIGTTLFPNASLEVNGGSVLDTFNNQGFGIGVDAGATGLLRVTGAGSEYNAIDGLNPTIGFNGQAEVIVENGGYLGLLSSGATNQFLSINEAGTNFAGSSAVITVQGAGSQIEVGGGRFQPPGTPINRGGFRMGSPQHTGRTEVHVLDGGEFFVADMLGGLQIGSNSEGFILGPNTQVTVAGGGSKFSMGVNLLLMDTILIAPGSGRMRLANGGIFENRGGTALNTLLSIGIGDDGSGATASGRINVDILGNVTGFELTVDPSTTLSLGDSFLLVDYANRVNNVLPGAGPGALVDAGGRTFLFDYDVPLISSPGRFGIFATVVPEPATLSLLAMGGGALMFRRRLLTTSRRL